MSKILRPAPLASINDVDRRRPISDDPLNGALEELWVPLPWMPDHELHGVKGNIGTFDTANVTPHYDDVPHSLWGAIDFLGGSGDTITVPNADSLQFRKAEPFSVGCVVRHDDQGGGKSGYLLDKNTNPAFWRLRYSGYGYAFDLRNTYNKEASVGTNTSHQTTAAWKYVLATYDGSETAAGLKIYVDGVDATTTQSWNLSGDIAGSADLEFGQSHDGRIGLAAIWRREIQAGEAGELYDDWCSGLRRTLNRDSRRIISLPPAATDTPQVTHRRATDYSNAMGIDLNMPISDSPMNGGLLCRFLNTPQTSGGTLIEDLAGGEPATHNGGAGPGEHASPGGVATTAYDKVDDYSSVAGLPDKMGGLSEWTIGGWVRPAVNFNDNPSPFFGDNGVDMMPTIRWNNAAEIQAFAGDGSGGFALLQIAKSFFVGTWYHILYTYDGTDGRLYVDGEKVGTVNDPGHTIGSTPTAARLGGGHSASADYYGGEIDDVVAFSRSMTDEQAKAWFLDSEAGAPKTINRRAQPARFTGAAAPDPDPAAANTVYVPSRSLSNALHVDLSRPLTMDPLNRCDWQDDANGDQLAEWWRFMPQTGRLHSMTGKHELTYKTTPSATTIQTPDLGLVGPGQWGSNAFSPQWAHADVNLNNEVQATLLAVVRHTANPGGNTYIASMTELDGSANGFDLRQNGGDLYFDCVSHSTARLIQVAGGAVLNEWQYLAMTYDGTDMKGYINGVERATATGFGPSNGLKCAGNDFAVGAFDSPGNFPWAGDVASVRVYRRALTHAEVIRWEADERRFAAATLARKLVPRRFGEAAPDPDPESDAAMWYYLMQAMSRL